MGVRNKSTIIWKHTKYYGYKVSNTGLVEGPGRGYCGDRKILKPYLNGSKLEYQTVCIYPRNTRCGQHGKNVRVHALVAEAFIGERPPKMTVNHMDGNKKNNHAANLEYCTIGDNIRHYWDNKKGTRRNGPPNATNNGEASLIKPNIIKEMTERNISLANRLKYIKTAAEKGKRNETLQDA